MSRLDSIEVEGVTVDEAIEAGLSSLGAGRADVDVEVLSSPTRGLFGLGGRKARVRVMRRISPSAPPVASAAVELARSAEGSSPALLEHARELLADLLRRMGFESEVAIAPSEDGECLQISGDNTSVLIGKHGQTLDALEYYLNRVVSREEEAATRIHVDCEEYRVKRRRSLETLAQRMGDEAKRKGRSISLDPMSPRDRRIVHLALQADPEVTTRSSGEGYYRRLVIIPEGTAPRRGRARGR
jgi:spoIIIJ-associated protein